MARKRTTSARAAGSRRRTRPARQAGPPPELVVVTRRQAGFRASAGRFTSAAGENVSGLQRLLTTYAASMTPIFGPTEERVMARLAAQSESAQAPMEDLSVFYRVDAPAERLEELREQLAASEVVEAAFLKPAVELPRINDMAAALEERIQRDARFASNVSHELRSPLMTLSASIEVLENQRGDMSERAKAALDLMVADIDRFRQLVEDLLEISRFDAGVMHLDLEEVHLAELIMQAVSTSTDADVPVDIDADLAGVVVKADKRRLVRVIANLLDNAAKYGDGATRVQLRKDEDNVLIAVEDNGPGVPPEDRESIFYRFNRGSRAGRRLDVDGVGLGLALVAEHVRLHGGSVWVEDRADGGQGSRFVIELPTEAP